MKKSLLCSLCLFVAILSSSSAALVVSNAAATNVQPTSAFFCGNLTATNGTTNAIALRLCYGSSDGLTNLTWWGYTNRLLSVASTGAFSTNVTGLTPTTHYYYRWYATQGTNTAWSTPSTNFWTTAGSPTGAPPSAATYPVMVDTNGDLVAPTNFRTRNFGTAATSNVEAFATAAQGAKADQAWCNPPDATDWLWSSDGVQITLTNYTGPNAVVIPEMLDGLPVTILSDNLFSPGGAGSGITSVTGGRNILTIGDAFTLCTNLESVCFPNATSVGDGPNGSFYGCWALSTVSMPSLKNAGGGAFGWCPALTSISLPSLTNLGNGAFFLCTSLTSVLFSANAPSVVGTPYSSIPANHVTNYVLNATATGWGATLGGMPVVRMTPYGSASSMTGCPFGAVPTNDARFLASTYLVSAPSSNAAAGTNGQVAITVVGGTNFVYFYDPNGGGAGTGRWVRTEGSVTW